MKSQSFGICSMLVGEMNSAMLTILSLSISGSALAIVLFVLKPLIKHKVSKAFSYYIWLVVLLRLVLPVAAPVNAMDALFNSPSVTPQTIEAPGVGEAATNNVIGNDVEYIAPEADAPPSETAVKPAAITPTPAKTFDLWAFVEGNLLWIWAAGVFASLAWFMIAYFRFYRLIKRKNVSPLQEDEAIFRSLCKNRSITLACNSYIKTPMLIGIFHPVIVVPQIAYARNGMGQTLTNILYHELTHYKRKDLAYKWLVVFVTSLHWFNPLMIPIRREIARACELSCDEAVIRNMTDKDKQIYGDTLLALSTNRRLPAGILATTLCERKSELKERLISIMKYKKKTVWIAILSVLLAVALTGCGVALGAATDKTGVTKVIDTNSTISEVGGADAPKDTVTTTTPAIVDFDGDGLEDSASISGDNTKFALLTVTLGSGKTIEKKIDGWWWPQETATGNSFAGGSTPVQTGDFDGDGKSDILVALLYAGSSGETRTVHVLRLENGEFAKYPTNYIASDVKYEIDKELKDFGADCMGAWVVHGENGALLRIREYTESMSESDSALYFDVAWNGSGWVSKNVNTGKAHSYEVGGQAQPKTEYKKLPAIHRDGFVQAQVTIIDQPKIEWTDDADHDPSMADKPLTNETAQKALRQLYDMTGVQIQKCYATGTERNVTFSMDKSDFNLKAFYSAYFNEEGECINMSIVYAGSQTDSPIDSSNVIRPQGFSSISNMQKAQWYYENSAFGDRCVIIGAEENSAYFDVKLIREDGKYYGVDFDSSTGLPITVIYPGNP